MRKGRERRGRRERWVNKVGIMSFPSSFIVTLGTLPASSSAGQISETIFRKGVKMGEEGE